jgi:DNA-binding NarL/FixJ family response regulator
VSVKILLADDHKIVVDGLATLLEKIPGYEVVARASDGLAAESLARELVPDVAILDISMPGLNGIEAARLILERNRSVRVIILSMHADGRFIAEALKVGALGYLLKESAFEELAAAIRTVMGGQAFLSAAIVDAVVKDYIRHLEHEGTSVFSRLGAREREVLQMLAEGLATKQIAGRLDLSVKTVETYRKQIMEKLDIHSIAELTKYAVREGITTL